MINQLITRSWRHPTAVGFLKVLGGENAAVLILFGVSVLAARVIGPEGVGLYAWAVAILSLGAQFSSVGMPTSYLVSPETRRSQLKSLTILLAISGAVVALLVAIFVYSAKREFGLTFWLLLLSLAYFPLSGMRALFRNVANIKGRYSILMWLPVASALVQGMLVVLLWKLEWLNAYTYAVVFVATVAVRVLIAIPTRQEWLEGEGNLAKSVRQVPGSIRYCFNDLSYIMFTQAPVFVLGLTATFGEAGIYAKAVQIAMLLHIVMQGLMPLFLTRWAIRSTQRVTQELKLGLLLVVVLGASTMAVIAPFSREILSFIFGSQFAAGATVLVISTISSFMLIAARMLTQAAIARGEVAQATSRYIIALFLMVNSYLLLKWAADLETITAMALAVLLANASLLLLNALQLGRRKQNEA